MKKIMSAKLAANLLLGSLCLLALFDILVLLQVNSSQYCLGRSDTRFSGKPNCS